MLSGDERFNALVMAAGSCRTVRVISRAPVGRSHLGERLIEQVERLRMESRPGANLGTKSR
jgi:hypothetical protein